MGKIFEKGVIGGWDINGKIYDRAVVEEYFLPDYIHKDKLQKVVEFALNAYRKRLNVQNKRDVVMFKIYKDLNKLLK